MFIYPTSMWHNNNILSKIWSVQCSGVKNNTELYSNFPITINNGVWWLANSNTSNGTQNIHHPHTIFLFLFSWYVIRRKFPADGSVWEKYLDYTVNNLMDPSVGIMTRQWNWL